VRQLEAMVKNDQAGIDSGKVQLDYTTILAPLEGRCGIRLVDQGNIVHANDAGGIVVITQLRPISVVFTLPEQDVLVVSKKLAQCPISVLALDRDNKTVLDTGTLAVVDNQIDPSTGSIKCKATFPNSNLSLWPGQFVNPRVLVDNITGLVVPENVIQRGPDGEYVFTVHGEGANMAAKLTPVTVARMQDDWALVSKGLIEGDTVVVDGQYRLEDGTKVRVGEGSQPAGSSGAAGLGDRRGTRGATNRPATNPPPATEVRNAAVARAGATNRSAATPPPPTPGAQPEAP
jgi:multidrug efflux system membrane fusion protein